MKSYKNGPVSLQKRSCTDILCLIIFCMLAFTLFSIAVYSWGHGNFSKLLNPYDSDGKGCGVDYPNYPYIYFTSLSANTLWRTVCVSQCPNETATQLKCIPNSIVTSCSPLNSQNKTQITQIYNTIGTNHQYRVFGTMCLPVSKILSQVLKSNIQYTSKQITTTIENYQLLILAFPIAIIIAIIIMILVRFTACIFVYILIFVVSGGLIGLGFFFLFSSSLSIGNSIFPYFQNQSIKNVVAIILISLGTIVLILMFCIRNKIFLVSKILEVAANFIGKNLYIIIFLIVILLFQGIVITIWIFQALGYYSLGEPNKEEHNMPYTYFQVSTGMVLLASIHLFYLFWWTTFLKDTNCFFISGTVASWYYSNDHPFADTLRRYFTKHIGSVFLGSFLKVIIGFLKFIYQVIEPKQQSSDESNCHSIFRKFFKCICCICQKMFQWLNKGGYIVMNITGDDYIQSINKGVQVRLNSIIVTGLVQSLQSIFQHIIQFGIISLTITSIYFIVDKVQSYNNMKDPTLIFVLVGVVGFSVSSFFTSAYVDTHQALLITYHMDIASGGKLKRIPEELRQFLAQARRKEHIISE